MEINMAVQYKKLTKKELDTFIEMRICQLREEGAKEEVDLKPALVDYYDRHMADGTFVSWLAVDGDKNEYEMLTMHFWIDTIHQELAVLCLLNPFKVQYFPLDSIEEIEPVVTYAGKKKDYAYGVYFNITINGKKTSVGVASSGRGSLINRNHRNQYLDDIQKLKDVIWKAKLKD